jgi:hypothetical protein
MVDDGSIVCPSMQQASTFDRLIFILDEGEFKNTQQAQRSAATALSGDYCYR